MLKELKEFAMRGNVVDMAVGIIIGAALGRIVSSLVNDVIMPPIDLLMGKVDFSDLFVMIVAFAIFLVIKAMNRSVRFSAVPVPLRARDAPRDEAARGQRGLEQTRKRQRAGSRA